VTCKNITKFMQ